MIQVSESRVAEVLDEFASRSRAVMSFDMVRGAVHLALRLGLIDDGEFARRCDALREAQFGPKKEDA